MKKKILNKFKILNFLLSFKYFFFFSFHVSYVIFHLLQLILVWLHSSEFRRCHRIDISRVGTHRRYYYEHDVTSVHIWGNLTLWLHKRHFGLLLGKRRLCYNPSYRSHMHVANQIWTQKNYSPKVKIERQGRRRTYESKLNCKEVKWFHC